MLGSVQLPWAWWLARIAHGTQKLWFIIVKGQRSKGQREKCAQSKIQESTVTSDVPWSSTEIQLYDIAYVVWLFPISLDRMSCKDGQRSHRAWKGRDTNFLTVLVSCVLASATCSAWALSPFYFTKFHFFFLYKVFDQYCLYKLVVPTSDLP